jgi:RNA polymerase sigma factor (sigma-70 family)
MVMDNMGLVHHVIRNHFPQYVNANDYEDIAQIGTVGLIKAVDRFDRSLNLQFATYAVPKIWGEIKRSIREDRYLKVPRSFYEKVVKLKSVIRKFILDNGIEPTMQELMTLEDLTIEEITEIMNYDTCLIYLEQVVFDNKILADTLSNDVNEYDQLELSLEFKAVLSDLKPEDRNIFIMYHINDMTQKEVADKLNINQVAVSRSLVRTKKKLQKELIAYVG